MSTESGFIVEDFDALPDAEAMAGVLFAEDFDLPERPVPAAAAAALQPADLQAARAAAYAEGLASGAAQAQARATHAEATALIALADALSTARQAAAAAAAAASTELARSVLQVLGAALPELCAQHGPAEAERLAASLLPMLAHQPALTIRANPHTMPALRHLVARQADPGRIVLIPTDALAEGDLTIDWQDGGLARDSAAIRGELARLLAPLGVELAASPAAAAIKELADA